MTNKEINFEVFEQMLAYLELIASEEYLKTYVNSVVGREMIQSSAKMLLRMIELNKII